ncbi:MAG: hypothetical protein WKF96_17295, partial [Solirubrobacteraceae bacterium]
QPDRRRASRRRHPVKEIKMAKKAENPDEIVHLQVKEGGTARLGGKAYGDRGTIQVRRGDRGQVTGPVEEVDPNEVPEVSQRPAGP